MIQNRVAQKILGRLLRLLRDVVTAMRKVRG